MKAVRAERIRLSFGDTPVLDGVDFSVAEGEFFAVIGPNGAGKTTLLRILAGLLRPDAGRAEVLGRDVRDYSRRDLARVAAMVPQTLPAEFPFTVAETVLMGRSPYLGLTGIETAEDHATAEEAMAFTDISHLATRRLDRLSGGELQRTVIARAICQQPRIILLDEPTASLDPSHQVRIMDLMERLRRERGTTVIMISHDLNLAAMYGDRLLLLSGGRILRMGSPAEVLTAPDLERAYGCPIRVDTNPLDGGPRVTPVPEKHRRRSDGKERHDARH